MLIVALTGGIACGKSVVAEFMRQKGCFVDSADRAAHELMSAGSDLWEEVVGHFGRGILAPGGAIDRARLGAIVFADASERAYLDSLVHPRVLARLRKTVEEVKKSGRHRIFISEAALVYESGFAPFFDRIVVAHCPEDVQIARLMARDGIGRDEAARKIRAQMPADEKARRADYLIDTTGSLAATLEQVERVYAMLVRDLETGRVRDKPGMPG
jgi:dephospho-CoA kinase